MERQINDASDATAGSRRMGPCTCSWPATHGMTVGQLGSNAAQVQQSLGSTDD